MRYMKIDWTKLLHAIEVQLPVCDFYSGLQIPVVVISTSFKGRRHFADYKIVSHSSCMTVRRDGSVAENAFVYKLLSFKIRCSKITNIKDVMWTVIDHVDHMIIKAYQIAGILRFLHTKLRSSSQRKNDFGKGFISTESVSWCWKYLYSVIRVIHKICALWHSFVNSARI